MLLIFPAAPKAFEASAKSMARREVVLTAITAERFQTKTGTLPEKIEDLVRGFLAVAPVDPFSGQRLLLRSDSTEFAIYSVGDNRLDAGGTGELTGNGPDIIALLKMHN